MYAEWTNQLTQIMRYTFAFSFILILWPKLIFPSITGDFAERLASRFIMMTLFLIVLGYLLVSLQLFEILAIFPIFLLMAARANIRNVFIKSSPKSKVSKGITKFYDYLEGKYDPKPEARLYLITRHNNFMAEVRQRFSRGHEWIESLMIIVVIIISGYIRFYDSMVNATPAMSDGYVTLAWIKYIDQRILFHDGIYPQGFYIWMDYLAKFSFSDPLYILKYTGPLNAILLMLGMYFAVSRWSGSRMAGLVSMIIYGLLGSVISGGSFERQASTNSQEFAFIFVIPTIYFLHQWLRDRIRRSLLVGIAGMMVVGLIHTLAYVFLGIAVVILLLIYIPLTIRERWRPIWPIMIGGVASLIVSLTPIGLGLLFGKTIHSSTGDFATSSNISTFFTELTRFDIFTLVALVIIFIWLLTIARRIREFTGPLFVGIFVLVTFFIYYLGNLFTFPGSTVITARSTELWSMMIPLGIGMAIGILFRYLRELSKNQYIEIVITALIISLILFIVPPKPIIPYKMEWNSGVEQYLKISATYRPKTWMIVSHAEEGYSLVLGKGNHTDTSEFLKKYDPLKWPLTELGATDYDRKIAKDIFVYYQKSVFRISDTIGIYALLEPIYEKREVEMQQLELWIKKHQTVNSNIAIWYEDEQLRIYHIRQPVDEKKLREQIWGEGVGFHE